MQYRASVHTGWPLSSVWRRGGSREWVPQKMAAGSHATPTYSPAAPRCVTEVCGLWGRKLDRSVSLEYKISFLVIEADSIMSWF